MGIFKDEFVFTGRRVHRQLLRLCHSQPPDINPCFSILKVDVNGGNAFMVESVSQYHLLTPCIFFRLEFLGSFSFFPR